MSLKRTMRPKMRRKRATQPLARRRRFAPMVVFP
uniref:Uncharacterized protein n=1 Tax=Arundo donax TaxID=35708 RepID=A0A0A8Y5R0_ARUDO